MRKSMRRPRIATALARSPSQAAVRPASFNAERARQPLVARCVTRSKQRTATASRCSLAIRSERAEKTVEAWRTPSGEGSRVAEAPQEKDAASHRGRALRALAPALRVLAARAEG